MICYIYCNDLCECVCLNIQRLLKSMGNYWRAPVCFGTNRSGNPRWHKLSSKNPLILICVNVRFTMRYHLIYLVNWSLTHCVRYRIYWLTRLLVVVLTMSRVLTIYKEQYQNTIVLMVIDSLKFKIQRLKPHLYMYK